MDPISIATAAAGVAQSAWKIYQFISDAKNVDKTLQRLLSEVKQVSEVFKIVKEQAKLIPGHDELLNAIKIQIDSCAAPIQTIKEKLSSGKKSSIFKQAFRQAKLNMDEDEINRCRDQIQKSIQNLQLSLLVINTQATYIAPQRADGILVSLLDNMQKALDTQGQKIDATMRYCTGDCIAKGTTLYAESIRGSIAGGDTVKKPSAVSDWLNQLQSMKIDDKVEYTDSTLPLADTLIDDTGPSFHGSSVHYDSDDSLDAGLARSTLTLGKEAFKQAKYERAELSLRESLKCIGVLSEHKRQDYNLEEIHLSLAICAFHLHDESAAEDALISAIGPEMKSMLNGDLKCTAIWCLVIIYVRRSKFEVAALTCENLYRGQRKLFGKDARCYRTLALLAAIHKLQGNSLRADAYQAMIPDDVRDEHCKEIEELALQHNASPAFPEVAKPVSERAVIDVARPYDDENVKRVIEEQRKETEELASQQNTSSASFGAETFTFEEAIADVAWSHDNMIMAVAHGERVGIRSVRTGRRKISPRFPAKVHQVVIDLASELLAVNYDRNIAIYKLYPRLKSLYILPDQWTGGYSNPVTVRMRFLQHSRTLSILRTSTDGRRQQESVDIASGKHEIDKVIKSSPPVAQFFTKHHIITLGGQMIYLISMDKLEIRMEARLTNTKARTVSAASSSSGFWTILQFDSSITIGKNEVVLHHLSLPSIYESVGSMKHGSVIYNRQEMLSLIMCTDNGKIRMYAWNLDMREWPQKIVETGVTGCTMVGFSPDGDHAFYTITEPSGVALLRTLNVKQTLGITD